MTELTVPLRSQVEEITAAHRATEECAAEAIRNAASCGRKLTGLKAELPHGEFIPFIEAKLPFTRQTASGYMRIAKAVDAGELEMESASSIRGALKQLSAPHQEEPSPVRSSAGREAFGPEIAAELVKAELLLADGRVRELSPKENWDLAERMDEIREMIRAAMSPFERVWLKHKGFVPADRLESIEETCEVAGMRALIEIVGDRYVWVGYVPVGADGEWENPLSYHPGWANYCRDRLGDDVRFATAEMMPYSGPTMRAAEVG